MIQRKDWNEFRNTGLLLLVNTILHAFGWVIVVQLDSNGVVEACYPARTKYRGFDSDDTAEAYRRIGNYIKENGAQIAEEEND